ncbi:unnamed protein product, partial [Heterosigma akashiwo]
RGRGQPHGRHPAAVPGPVRAGDGGHCRALQGRPRAHRHQHWGVHDEALRVHGRRDDRLEPAVPPGDGQRPPAAVPGGAGEPDRWPAAAPDVPGRHGPLCVPEP